MYPLLIHLRTFYIFQHAHKIDNIYHKIQIEPEIAIPMLNKLILKESNNLTSCPKVRKLKDCDKEGPTEARPGCWSPGTTGNINLFATGIHSTYSMGKRN